MQRGPRQQVAGISGAGCGAEQEPGASCAWAGIGRMRERGGKKRRVGERGKGMAGERSQAYRYGVNN